MLRKFFKQDYRGTADFLLEWSDIREILELGDTVQHYTTLQKNNAKLQDAMEAIIPHCQDDLVVIYADVEGKDSNGDLRGLPRPAG